MKNQWVPHDLRDQLVDFVHPYVQLTELPLTWFLGRIPLSPRKFRRWQERCGKANEHNALAPRDHWIEPAERQAIIDFALAYPLEGYRRLTFMMLDRDLVAVSPSNRLSRAAPGGPSSTLEPEALAQGPRFRAAAGPT